MITQRTAAAHLMQQKTPSPTAHGTICFARNSAYAACTVAIDCLHTTNFYFRCVALITCMYR